MLSQELLPQKGFLNALPDGSLPGGEEITCRIPLAQIGRGLEKQLEATSGERTVLARRFKLVDLQILCCSFALKAVSSDTILARGHLQARLKQSCIITGESLDETIDEHFSLRFVPHDQIPDDDSPLDIERLLVEEADDVPHDGCVIDLGAAMCEQLALCLNPYPRCVGSGLENFVDMVPEDETDISGDNEKRNPFVALQQLKDRGKIV